jgi:hypothetical protein
MLLRDIADEDAGMKIKQKEDEKKIINDSPQISLTSAIRRV